MARQDDRPLPAAPAGGAALGPQIVVLLLVLGCLVSSGASGRFSVRLILDGALSFAFIPAAELLAFTLVWCAATGARVPWSRAAGAFMAGNRAWLVWLVALAAILGVLPPRATLSSRVMLATALVPAAWSVLVDLRFFREVLRRSSRGAVVDVVVTRVVAWGLGTASFFGIAIWSLVYPTLSRWSAW